jgi:hypothetical protein
MIDKRSIAEKNNKKMKKAGQRLIRVEAQPGDLARI